MGPRTPAKTQSSIRIVLSIGFGLLLLIMSAIWWGNFHQMAALYQTIEKGRLASEKMDLIASLIEVARNRTRLTNEMLYLDDPFEKDDINMRLDEKATEFTEQRAHLIDLGLSEEEQAILYLQNAATRRVLMLQRKAAEMALSDDPKVVEEARHILIFEVYPGQGIIIDSFMRLLQLQKQIIDQATQAAGDDYRATRRLQSFLFIVVFAVSLLIAYYVIRRTTAAEGALFLEKERALITLRSIGDGVITTDAEGRIDYMNPIAERLTGYDQGEALEMRIGDVLRAYDEGKLCWVAELVQAVLSGERSTLPSNEILLISAAQQQYNIALTLAPITDYDGHIQGTVTTFQDVTSSRQLARKIEYQAKHDPLTGLMNRREFEQKVVQALRVFERGTSHAMAIVDLDRFKFVNDSCGHAAGDELLRQLAQHMRPQVRRSDLIARIGGDEFALFLTNIDTENAEEIANRLLQTIREYRFLWKGKSFQVGACIGLVDAPPELSDYSYLYHAADTACFLAKREGRDRVRVISLDDVALSQKREETEWIGRIQLAFEEGLFELYSQAIVPLKESSEEQRPHCEILIRMRDGSGQISPPMSFIPVAERYGLMPKIDLWVTGQVIDWMHANPADQAIYSVNLSGQTIGDPESMDRVVERVRSSGIDPWRLCFEVTETATIANLEAARCFMHGLRDLGCQIALDDFGSGLSSFAYLKNLPIDYLKIDGMFIRQVVEDRSSRIMVDAIHSIGNKMGLRTVAEYVESAEIAAVLREIGVDYGQGYHFESPRPLGG